MAAAFRALVRAPILTPPVLELRRNGQHLGAPDRIQACRIGAREAGRRQTLEEQSWKKNAATCLGLLATGGLVAGASLNSPCRMMTGRSSRGHAYDVGVSQGHDKRTRLKTLDGVEDSLQLAAKSEIVWKDTFTKDDDLSSNRKATESVTTLFQHLFPARLIEGDKVTGLVTLALIASVIGLQACSPAWGLGTEIARAKVDSGFFGDLDDIQNGFASSFLLIFFSEIGDKTFFIAALLATRKPGAAVFSGTFGALAVMTVISVVLGRAFHYVDELLPSVGDTRIPWDDLAAGILLVYFGVSTLIEAASMEESKQQEEQQEAELAIAGVGANGAVASTVAATFALVFVAEWGDKSFFSTIALAAASSPLGVVTGAVAGHGAATLLAVLGGSFLANYVSEKVIAYVGGILFLVFAGITLVETLS